MSIRRCHPAFVCCALSLAFALPSVVRAAPPEASKPSISAESPLMTDKRLNHKVSVDAGNLRLSRLCRTVSVDSPVRLSVDTDDGEMNLAALFLGCKTTSLLSVMDAMAAANHFAWVRTDKGGYKLTTGDTSLSIFLPKDALHRERYAAGRVFLAEMSQLPPETLSQLRSGGSVPASALTGRMLDSIKTMLRTVNQQNHKDVTTDVNAVDSATIKLEARHPGDFTSYFLSMKAPRRFAGWEFNDYEDKLKEKQAKEKAGTNQPVHDAKLYTLSNEAARKLPDLQKPVTAHLKRVTFPQVLEYLSATYNLPFACDPEKYMSQRADVDLSSMPLAEALDSLTQIYTDTEWEYRKLGFLIIRGPKNPRNQTLRKKEEERAKQRLESSAQGRGLVPQQPPTPANAAP